MKYIATFFTHSGAVKYQRWMKKRNINIELMPVPRKISSNCGLAAQFELDADIRNYISEDIEKLFQVTEDGYKNLFQGN
ncbi:MAG TPA: DUF3343 domain-containing protein [Firmicutes bacterium]|jgi:hypothetical protein|nr:DUF3343 domain-containing protein [Bacillota bacterium]